MRLLDRILFEKAAPLQIRYLARHDYSRAPALARAVLDQMDADFLIGPPLTLHIPNPELMAGVWSGARECVAAGQAGRPVREVVSAVISRLNACPYCYDIHTSMLYSWGRPALARAVWRKEKFPDPAIQAIADWAAATLTPGAPILSAPPFSQEDAPAIIGTAVGFHYLNRIVNVFLDASPVPFRGQGGWFKGQLIRLSGRILQSRLARQTLEPGRFLIPLAGTLPPEFAWATGNPYIAGGFQRFATTAEAAGEESVDPAVRALVTGFLSTWRGEAPALGRAWLEDAIAPLDPALRPSARIALFAAVASWQFDDALIADYTKHLDPAQRDRHLVNLVSWSCYATARRIASWLSSGLGAPA